MPAPLVVSIPHSLGREEAMRRLKNGLTKAASSVPVLHVDEERWEDNRMNFRVRALGQAAAGQVDVRGRSCEGRGGVAVAVAALCGSRASRHQAARQAVADQALITPLLHDSETRKNPDRRIVKESLTILPDHRS